jgi:hypothetical protein
MALESVVALGNAGVQNGSENDICVDEKETVTAFCFFYPLLLWFPLSCLPCLLEVVHVPAALSSL